MHEWARPDRPGPRGGVTPASRPTCEPAMKILIAEDNHFYRNALEITLREWGYEVVALADGQSAWDILKAPGAPKLAILDWMMPGMDGLEVCRKLRQLHKHEPT